jgi:gluconate kinase
LRFAHLQGSRELIADRLQARQDHYMPPALLDSQLQALEPLQPDEAGLTLDVSAAAQQLAERIADATQR